ncbi:hypothetical protein SAMN05216215_109717 [Saccharopolyspora shandongensis]|uniref:Uncharacterized protein n=1 Tax=Saccharopolyspora shandongensis TaxID=418495 RepID=A0A1H3U1C1_9PSEU|nr:hypothetical protein [Saccharopolyspora shandongensis]SDZ55299.1 hypothetical protein SAMN05216215_109717 [Saccharopolyspora shandongensis]
MQSKPSKSRSHWWARWWVWTIAAGMVALPFGAWSVVAALSPEPFNLRGELTLGPAAHVRNGPVGCKGGNGYEDITEGTQVTVSSAAGEVLAVGELGNSAWSSSTLMCRFRFMVPNVPGGHDIYRVEVSRRGAVPVPADEALAGHAALELG